VVENPSDSGDRGGAGEFDFHAFLEARQKDADWPSHGSVNGSPMSSPIFSSISTKQGSAGPTSQQVRRFRLTPDKQLPKETRRWEKEMSEIFT